MRILTKIMGFSFILIFSILIMLELLSFNVHYDELVNVTSLAMDTTQLLMQEQIEDYYFDTNTRRKTISSNEEYLKEFKTNLDMLVTTDSEYKIYVFGIDFEKGFIDVQVDSEFKMFNGETKIISLRKTSIVEVIEP